MSGLRFYFLNLSTTSDALSLTLSTTSLALPDALSFLPSCSKLSLLAASPTVYLILPLTCSNLFSAMFKPP